jgi:predicted transcriptional regulator
MKQYSRGQAHLSIALNGELLDRLNEYAQDSGESRNSIVVAAIERELHRVGRDKKDETK